MRSQFDTRNAESWVVYQVLVRTRPGVVNAVCSASEWEMLEAGRPGFYTLIKGGISSESEAEHLARLEPAGPVEAKAPRPAQA